MTESVTYMKDREKTKNRRVGTTVENISGRKMKCIDYKNSMDIDVEFLDSGNIIKNVQWNNFIRGKVKDKQHLDILSYNSDICSIPTDSKEYRTWYQMLRRCFNIQYKEEKPTYKNAVCCEEWLSYENFCIWLQSQENYEIWKTLKWSAIDKDILIKGNKIYSPENCLLVAVYVNNLFVKHDALRGNYPIGVHKLDNKYVASCTNSIENRHVVIGLYNSIEEAFKAYKEYKENLIKEIANIEYKNRTITKKCRDAMYSYKVEIND